MHACSAAAAKLLQSCPTLCDPIDGGHCLGDSPGKNTGVGCHFLLQCMKVHAQSYSILGPYGLLPARLLCPWNNFIFKKICHNTI